MTLRGNIKAAFAELRKKHGFFARMDWKCCQGCGWAAVPEAHDGPIAFFHQQDNDNLRDDGYCYIAFGHSADESCGDDLSQQAGETLVAVLRKHGCEVEWDGDTMRRPKVLLPAPVDPPDAPYKLTDNQRKFVADATEQDLEIDYDYSGRGMYGKTCPAVRLDGMGDFATKAETSWDNMGLGYVVYARG